MNASTRCIVGALALSFALAPLALADTGPYGTQAETSQQTQQLHQDTRPIDGTVVSTSANTLVIRTDAGALMSFVVDEVTVMPVGLGEGTPVHVDYHDLNAGAYHAATVTRATPPATTPAVTPPAVTPAATTTPVPAEASPTTRSIDGTVVSSSPNTLVVRTSGGTMMTFVVDDATTGPEELSTGTAIEVDFHDLTAGGYHASVVRRDSTPPMTSPPMTSATADRMPDTASPLGILALAGLAALGAGVTLHVLRNR